MVLLPPLILFTIYKGEILFQQCRDPAVTFMMKQSNSITNNEKAWHHMPLMKYNKRYTMSPLYLCGILDKILNLNLLRRTQSDKSRKWDIIQENGLRYFKIDNAMVKKDTERLKRDKIKYSEFCLGNTGL